MSDGSFVQYAPFITFFGPIIGALIGAAITWYVVVPRKEVTFWVSEPEDITRPLLKHYPEIKFRVSGRDFDSLNRSMVVVKSTGNRSVNELKFDIEIPGLHTEFLAELGVENEALRKSIGISWDEPRKTEGPRFHVDVTPFIKPKEAFRILLFFDGSASECLVHCRMDDVEAKVKHGEPLSFTELFARAQPEARVIVAMGVALMAAGLGTAGRISVEILEKLVVWIGLR
ncbi:MAG: hypothetical protein ABIL01_18145 [Pseudomonadota bacterium]